MVWLTIASVLWIVLGVLEIIVQNGRGRGAPNPKPKCKPRPKND
jgi:hypothetical protein